MSKLNDLDFVQSLDKSDMAHLIIHTPEQVYKGYKESVIHVAPSFAFDFEEHINHIVICGMGGSAISGDIAQVLFKSIKPITVVKDFDLPHIDDKTFCIIVSYSGNTEESVECLKKALSVTPYVAAVTSGGKVKELIDPNHFWIEIPTGLPPRAAIGYLFFSLLKVLETLGFVPNHHDEVESVMASLMQKAGSLCLKTSAERNLAKSSAESIHGKIPVIYSSSPILNPVAYRWKCQINENAKLPAFNHSFPEMTHNEIEAWETEEWSKKFIPIFLRLFDDDKKYIDKITRFQELLSNQKVEFLEFYGDGDNKLCNMFTLIYLGDMISFCLGILNNVDPTEIEFINYTKH